MKKTLFIVLILLFGITPTVCMADIVSDSKIIVKTPTNLLARKGTTNSIKLKWKKEKNVDGYYIYKYNKMRKKYVRIAKVGMKKSKYVDKGLKINKIYKYKVSAYKMQSGRIYESKKTYWTSAKTYKTRTKYINAGRLKGIKSVSLGMMSEYKVNVIVKASRYGKNIMKYPISTQLRWNSSDSTIVSVDKNGILKTGSKVGQCYVYAMAHNGNRKAIKVEVKDYTKSNFELYNGNNSVINELLTNYKNEVCDITKYSVCNYSNNKLKINQNSEDTYIVSGDKIDLSPVDEQIKNVLFKFPMNIEIIKKDRIVQFCVKYYDGTGKYDALTYMIDNDGLNESLIDTAAASHWQVITFRP